MNIPFVGEFSTITQGLSSQLNSLFGGLPRATPSILLIGIGALFVLPFVGMFFRPVMRILIACMYSISNIGSALLLCVSAWCVTLIEVVTLLGRAIRPGPKTEAIIRMLVPAVVVGFIVYKAIIPLRYMVFVGLLVGSLFTVKLLKPVLYRLLLRIHARYGTMPTTISATFLFMGILVTAYVISQSEGTTLNCFLNSTSSDACYPKLDGTHF